MNLNKILKEIKLNSTEKQVIEYLEKNVENLSEISIQKVAEDTYTSTSSVFRLAKKLGFTGYKELVYHLVNNGLEKDFEKRNIAEVENFSKYINKMFSVNNENLEKLLESIDENSSITILANGYSAIIGEYFSKKLLVHGFRVINIDSSDTLKIIENNIKHITHVFIISRSGETRSLTNIIESVDLEDKNIVTFTENSKSTLAIKSNIVFEIDEETKSDWDNIHFSQFHPFLLIYLEYILSKLEFYIK